MKPNFTSFVCAHKGAVDVIVEITSLYPYFYLTTQPSSMNFERFLIDNMPSFFIALKLESFGRTKLEK